MSKTLTLELPDEVYEAVQQAAQAMGQPAEQWITTNLDPLLPELPERNGVTSEAILEQKYQAACTDLEQRSPRAVELLQRIAQRYGLPEKQYIIEWVEKHPPGPPAGLPMEEWLAARERLRRYAGAVNSGNPRSGDNEAIDADLAREYENTHEEED